MEFMLTINIKGRSHKGTDIVVLAISIMVILLIILKIE